MIRVRLKKYVHENELERDGYTKVVGNNGVEYYTKSVGKYEIQIKKGFPPNVRIKDWDDNKTPWILMKFLLDLEMVGPSSDGRIKICSDGRYYILSVDDTLELIKELNKYTDIQKRFEYWYKLYLENKITF